MLSSRLKSSKKVNPKLPLWLVGLVIVIVVIITGYAIVRFSRAGGTGNLSGGGTGPNAMARFNVNEMNGFKGAYKTKIVHPNGSMVYGKEPIDVWALPKGAGVVGFGKEIYSGSKMSVNYCVNGFRLNGEKGVGSVTFAPATNIKASSFNPNISQAANYCSGDSKKYLQIPALKNTPINLTVVNSSNSILYVIDTYLFY